jgi:hypothetical protein
MDFNEILSRLDILEKRMVQGVKDNMRIQQIHLKIFADGSGLVDADWSEHKEGAGKDERLLRAIFSKESPLFEFSHISELERWLKDMTPKEEDGAVPE